MRDKHKQVLLVVTQHYDWENMENMKEHWAEELKNAYEVAVHESDSWITYKFQMDHEIAQRIKTMFKVFFGVEEYQQQHVRLSVEIEELNRTMEQQDHDYIVNQIPYDED